MILVLTSWFLVLFCKYLNPEITLLVALCSTISAFWIVLIEFTNILVRGSFLYVDFGCLFRMTESIDCHLTFCFDSLAMLLSALVLVLTNFAILFGIEYMNREAFLSRVVYLLVAFATMVVFLFCTYDFLLVVVAWESIGFLSYLLVNFYSQRVYIMKSSIKVFLFSRISDVFIMSVFFINLKVFGTTDMALIFFYLPYYSMHYWFYYNYGISFIFLYSMLIAMAGMIKAAQMFTHTWLPDAMQAPTPASALIHSSTLVVMGIYLMMRFQIAFEFSLATCYYVTMTGATTIGFGAYVATYQQDAKKLVAYSTISQIGYLVTGCGFLAYEETLLYLVIHAINKAFLFIMVGYSVHFHQANTDLRQMTTVVLYSSDKAIFIFITAVNLMGLPYLTGFYSKEFLVEQVMKDDAISFWVRSMWWVSFICTPLYMIRLADEVVFKWKKIHDETWFELVYDYCMMYYREYRRPTLFEFLYTTLTAFQRAIVCGKVTACMWFIFSYYLLTYGEWLLLYIMDIIAPTSLFTVRYNMTNEPGVVRYFSWSFYALNFSFFFILNSLQQATFRVMLSYFKYKETYNFMTLFIDMIYLFMIILWVIYTLTLI